MGQYFSWRSLFFMLGGAGILYAPLLLLLLHNAPGPAASGAAKKPSFLAAAREVAHIRTLRLLCLAFVGYSIVGSVMQTWLPYFLFHKFHTSLTTAGFSAAFYLQLPTALGNIAWGTVGDYFATRAYRGRMLVQAASLMISAPFLLSMGLAGSLVGVAASLTLLGFLRTGWPPNVMAVIFQLVPPRLSSTTYGLLNFCGNVSAGLALLVASDVGARFGFGSAFASLCSVHAMAAGILLFAAYRTLRRDFREAPPRTVFAPQEVKRQIHS
jgi:sugar phosphate permease